jgi:septum formation protein
VTVVSGPLVLASASPRRRELLAALGLEFRIEAADIDESPRAGEGAEAYVRRLALEKASAVAAAHAGSLVLGADTVVVVDGEILGKPRDAEDARRMLRRLAGRGHQVLTGVAVVGAGEGGPRLAEVVRTEVLFTPMDEAEIGAYVASGEPLDKAGAYAIQGLGARYVESISGNYSNVVGLPLPHAVRLLRRAGCAARS